MAAGFVMTKEKVYGKTPDIPESPQGSTIQAITETVIPNMTENELTTAFTQYAKNFSGLDQTNYIMSKMLARTTRNKRDHMHYFTVFINLYFTNLKQQLPVEKHDDIEKLRENINTIRKELAKVLEDVKVDDTGMVAHVIGMTEGLL